MPSPKEFLDAVWSGVAEGHVWTRTFEEGGPADAFYPWPSGAEDLLSALSTAPALAFMGAGLRVQESTARGDVLAAGALWATVNLTSIPFVRAADALRSFPAKPSAGLVVGDALHAFWFLKSPARAAEFDALWAANRAALARLTTSWGRDWDCDPFLVKSFPTLQASHYDFDGLVRAPGQPGAKFVAWRPEARYAIDEFVALVVPPRPLSAGAALAPAAAPAPAKKNTDYPPPIVSIEGEKALEIAKLVGGMWLEGTRMPSYVAGMLVHKGVSLDSAKAIMTAAVERAKGDVQRAVDTLVTTYQRASEDKPVSGSKKLEELFEQHYAPDDREKALKKIAALEKLLPKPKEADPTPDFTIIKLVKFDSRPARWSVTLKLSNGEEVSATVETQTFHQFIAFQSALQEQTHVMLMDIRQRRWKTMIGEARQMIDVKETPKEARPEGAIESAIDDFFSEAKEKPDVGMLRSFAAYDDDGRFFRYIAFKDFLKENGMRYDDRVVYEHLKQLGFKNTVKRFGPRLQRLWLQAYEGNGNGNGNGHAHPEPPAPIQIHSQTDVLSPSSDLFPDESKAPEGGEEGEIP